MWKIIPNNEKTESVIIFNGWRMWPHASIVFIRFNILISLTINLVYVLFRACPASVAQTLDTNKYKILTKITLDGLEIVKGKSTLNI